LSVPATSRHRTGPSGPVLFLVAAFLIVFAPLIRAGNRPLPLMLLEAAGLLGLVLAAIMPSSRALRGVPVSLWWGAGILLVTPLVQLAPLLPWSWWEMLPGHEPYVRALEAAGGAPAQGLHALSLHARATEYAWLALIPCLAIFVLVQHLDRRRVRRLVFLFIFVAVCEATLGIMQLRAPAASLLHLGNPYGAGGSTGTYVNKNHFAALMAMALPVLMALWAAEVLPPVSAKGEVLRDHPRNRDVRLARRLGLSVFVMALVLALLFSRSRAGIASGLAVLALASLSLVWNAGSVHARVILGVIAAAALALGVYIGLTPVLERFSAGEISLGYDGRMRIAAGTLGAALDFLPFGSGLGTFADVFRRYQLQSFPGFIDHAHNDYAEAFLELGVAGIAAIALLFFAYLMRWRALLASRPSRSLGYLQVGAGLGMLALIAHAMFDFNFHIPANAICFSFLAGVFFFIPGEGRG
jgi:O-antigen ligase